MYSYWNMKKIYIAIVVVAVLVILGWAYSKNKTDQVPTGEPIKIGAILSLSGDAAAFGEMAQMGIELAVDEINSSGGIDGRPVEVYIEDDYTSAKDAVSAWRKLVDVNGTEAIIGGLFDFTAQPLFPLAQNEKITFVSPINFTTKGVFEMNDYSFVMYPEFEKVIKELDVVIGKLGIQKLGMVRYQSDFGAEIERVLGEVVRDRNLAPVATETYAQIGGSDFRTPILKLKEKGVDSIFLDMLDFDIITFLSRAKEVGFEPTVLGYTTVRDLINNPNADKALTEGIVMLDWEIPSSEYEKRFENRYDILPRRGSDKSYDAVYVLAEAIAKSDNLTNIPTYLTNNVFDNPNASVKFTKDHNVENTPVEVYQVKDGKLVEF